MKKFSQFLREQQGTSEDVSKYDGKEDFNKWQWKNIDLIAQKKLSDKQFLNIYVPVECIERIKNFPNKNLLNEILDFFEKTLNEPNEIMGKENQIKKYLSDQISQAYKRHFVNSFDCLRSSCLNFINTISQNEEPHVDSSKKSLTLSKKTLLSLSKWASVARTFAAVSDSLKKFEPEIFFTNDTDFQNFYYSYKELKVLMPILISVVESIT